MSRAVTTRQAFLIGTAIAVVLLVAVGANPLLRGPLAFGLVLLGPGLAWSWIFRIRSPEMEVALAVALSIAVEILSGLLLLGLDAWSPGRLLLVVVAIVVAGVATEIQAARRSVPEGT